MIRPETLTSAMIRREMRRSTLVSVGADCAIALEIDARTANGCPPSDDERRAARQRICDAINAAAQHTCGAAARSK